MTIEKATKTVLTIQNPFAFDLWITLIDDDCFWTSLIDSNHEIPFLVSNVGQRKVHEGHYNVTTWPLLWSGKLEIRILSVLEH